MTFDLQVDSVREATALYLTLLHRFHKLPDKEAEFAVELILAYMDALDLYKHPVAAAKLYLEKDVRDKIKKRLGQKDQVFRNYLLTLKKKNVLKEDGTLNGALIPRIEPGPGTGNKYTLSFNIMYAQKEPKQGLDTGASSEGDSTGAGDKD